MLRETKVALRISTDAYDGEIARLIEAGAAELRMVGVPVEGVEFEYADFGAVVTDRCDGLDPLVQRAIITYVRLHFGSPDDYDRLERAYFEQKAQLITARGYGLPEVGA